jgi:hypothetical protein
MKKLVMVDVLSQYRMRYVVEVGDDVSHALDEVTMRLNDIDFQEFSQLHLGETIISHKEIDKADYLRMFDEDNDYLKEWTEEEKLKFVNKIDYKE